jgi:hypothetical protein
MASGLAGTALVSLVQPVFGQTDLPDLADYGPEFLSGGEWVFIIAATSQLIPSDGKGSGA